MKTMKKSISVILAIVMSLSISIFAYADSVTTTALLGTSGTSSNESFSKLFDRNEKTKWCVTNFNDAYGIWKMSSPVAVSGYTICTANDNSTFTGRNPASWKLYGCNAVSTPSRNYIGWNLISEVTSDTILKDVNYTAYDYQINKTVPAYQYYKLEITKTKGAGVLQIAEFTLNYSGSTKFTGSNSSSSGNFIGSKYITDGAVYDMQVGDLITLYNPRQPASMYYAYSWIVAEGENLVTLDRNNSSCRVTANSAGMVKITAYLDYSILGLGHREYKTEITLNIKANSASSSLPSSISKSSGSTLDGIKIGAL